MILRYFSRYRPHGTYCGTAYVILPYFSRYCPYGTYCGTTYVFLRCFSRYCPTAVRPTYSYAVHMVSLLTCRSVPYVPTGGPIVKIEDFGPDLLVCFIAPSYFMHPFYCTVAGRARAVVLHLLLVVLIISSRFGKGVAFLLLLFLRSRGA